MLVVGWAIHFHGATIAVAAEAERETISSARYILIPSAANKPRADIPIFQKSFPFLVKPIIRDGLAKVPALLVGQNRDFTSANGVLKFPRDRINVVQWRFWEHSNGWPVSKKLMETWWTRKGNRWVGRCLQTTRPAAEKAECHYVVDNGRDLPAVIKAEDERKTQSLAFPFAIPPLLKIVRDGSDKKVWLVQSGKSDFPRVGLDAGLFPRVQPKPAGGNPQSGSDYSQNGGEKDQKRVSDLHAVAKERRPELGSLLVALLTLVCGMVGGGQAWRFERGWKASVCFLSGAALILDGTIGFLFGLDPWSIYRWWSLG